MQNFKLVTVAFAISVLMAAVALSDASAQGRTIWEGFHFGFHGGAADHDFGISQTAPALPLVAIDDSADGFIGGFTYGTTWRSGQWVYGTDSDWSWTDATTGLNITGTAGAVGPRSAIAEIDTTFSTRGRVGYLVGSRLWIYGTAGIAFTKVDVTGTLIAGGGQEESYVGIVYGVGFEATWPNRWFARVEYLRTDYGDEKFAEVGGGTFVVDLDSDVVRGVIGFRFDWSPLDLLKSR